jgi:putative transposase
VEHLRKSFGLSTRRACRLVVIPRSTYNYDPIPNDDEFILGAIDDILKSYSKYGCNMIHLKLRQKGIHINHKRTERIYRENNLQLKARKRRKKVAAEERISPECHHR